MSKQSPALIEFQIVVLKGATEVQGFANQQLLQLVFFDLAADGLDSEGSLAEKGICRCGVDVDAGGRGRTGFSGRNLCSLGSGWRCRGTLVRGGSLTASCDADERKRYDPACCPGKMSVSEENTHFAKSIDERAHPATFRLF